MREIEIDRLLEKHEYFGYDEAGAKSMTVDVAGVPTRVLVPDDFPDVEPIVVADRGDLLFIVGEVHAPPAWNMEGSGAVLVARRRANGAYAVQIWHELYPFALAGLGLRARPAGRGQGG
jgi:hypothetical protein